MSIPAKFLTAAASLMARASGVHLTRQEMDEMSWAGYRAEDAGRVAGELRSALRAGAAYDARYRSRAWQALARRRDPADLSLFRAGLREELGRDSGVAWAIMVALEEMGESVISPGRGGGALWEEEANRDDAEAYLRRVEVRSDP
jgi:hypothetical protein